MATSTLGTVDDLGWRLHPTKLSVVVAVVRRLIPSLIEATLIPTIIFYVVVANAGLMWAFLAAAAWTFGCVGRRLVAGRAVPGLLVLACIGISIRTGIYIWSQNAFVYFAQPVLRTLLTAGAFALSARIGRPIIARFAQDFCPLDPEVLCRPAITRLFRRLTYQWACVNAALGTVSLALLWTVSTTTFVGATTAATWLVTAIGLYLTVTDAVGTARSEGLTTAVAPNGLLRAYALPDTGR